MSPNSEARSMVETRAVLREIVLRQMREEPKITRRFKIVNSAAAVATNLAPNELLVKPRNSNRTVLAEMVDNTIPRLASDGLIRSTGRGHYVLTAQGKRVASKASRPRGARLSASRQPRRPRQRLSNIPSLGTGYHHPGPASLRVSKRREVLVAAWDLNSQDAQTVAHARAVDELAVLVTDHDLFPLVPAPGDPLFDLAYWRGKALSVVEVKTLPQDLDGQRQQIRLGLGQVLEYACALSQRDDWRVRPVLLLASQPTGAVRQVAQLTCRRHDVRLQFAPLAALPR